MGPIGLCMAITKWEQNDSHTAKSHISTKIFDLLGYEGMESCYWEAQGIRHIDRWRRGLISSSFFVGIAPMIVPWNRAGPQYKEKREQTPGNWHRLTKGSAIENGPPHISMPFVFGLSSGNALKSNCYGYMRLIWHLGFLFHRGQSCFVFKGENIFVFALLCFVKLNCRELMNNRKNTKDCEINIGTKQLLRRDGWGESSFRLLYPQGYVNWDLFTWTGIVVSAEVGFASWLQDGE